MNAAPPVLQAQPSSGPVQPNAPDSGASATSRTGGQDFAAALSDAGNKPARKNTSNKHQDTGVSGSPLPPAGNQPPHAPKPPPPAATEAPTPVAANVPAPIQGSPDSGAPGTGQAPLPKAVTAAAATQTNATDVATILTAENLDAAASSAGAFAPATASLPTAAPPPDAALSPSADLDATAPANAPSVPVSGQGMPHAASTQIVATPGTSVARTVPATAANALTAKPADATTNPRTKASTDSTPSSDAAAPSDSPSNTVAEGADAAVQAAMAAAIAQGTGATAPDSAFNNELAASAGDLPSGAAALSAPAAGTPAAGAAAPALAPGSATAISAAVTAATAASIAQEVSATAGTGATDKRSHGNSADSTLSGASNDGSLGAAQLLTSNTSTDSVPMPTFKVAAGVDTAQFGQGVADRVALMMDGNVTSAKLQVNPPALGPIEVRIALQGGHAQVSFSSHSAVTRDALESSSEKLREMLGSQGFSSVNVDVSQRSFQERSPPSHAYDSAPAISGDAPVSAQATLSMARSASGLLDAYA